MKRLNYSITDSSTVVFIDGEVYTIPKTHPSYNSIVLSLTDDAMDEEWKIREVEELADIRKAVESYAEGRITIEGETLYYREEAIPADALVERIMTLRAESRGFEHLIKFLDNLMDNPNQDSRDDLYRFLTKNNLPITENGTFLAYKVVRESYFDLHSNTYDNSIGAVIEMPRSEVDPNRNNTCSEGFHAASYEYIPWYGNMNSDKVVIVEINPQDVVSVPIDHNDAKLRTCKYRVIGEMKNPHIDRIKSNYVNTESGSYLQEDFQPYDNVFDDYDEDEDDFDGDWYGDEEDEWEDEEEFVPYQESKQETEAKNWVGEISWISNGVKKEGDIIAEVPAGESIVNAVEEIFDAYNDDEVSFSKVQKAKDISSKDRYIVIVYKIDGVDLTTPRLYAPNVNQIN